MTCRSCNGKRDMWDVLGESMAHSYKKSKEIFSDIKVWPRALTHEEIDRIVERQKTCRFNLRDVSEAAAVDACMLNGYLHCRDVEKCDFRNGGVT